MYHQDNTQSLPSIASLAVRVDGGFSIKPSFQKHNFDFPLNRCFYCLNKPMGILTERDGSEVKACHLCATRKVRRLRKKVIKVFMRGCNDITFQKEAIFEQNSCSDNSQMPILKSVSSSYSKGVSLNDPPRGDTRNDDKQD